MKQKERPLAELQYMFLLALMVAGKNAKVVRASLDRLLRPTKRTGELPFDYLKRTQDEGLLDSYLHACRTGQYTKITKCLNTLFAEPLDLRTCSVDDLEDLPGIGPKSSRFFLMYTRPGYRCAVLDVHILRFMREHGIDAPEHTPQNRSTYKKLEREYLRLAERLGVDPTELDDAVWQKGAGWIEE